MMDWLLTTEEGKPTHDFYRDGVSGSRCGHMFSPGPASQLCCTCVTLPEPSTSRSNRPASTTSAAASHSSKASRRVFVSNTQSSLLASTLFTNHESLPSLPDALSNFLSAFPDYHLTQLADRLRLLHYPHLSLHTPLDYSGFPLFSPSHLPSFTVVAAHPNPTPDHALESSIKSRIMSSLNISPDDYRIVLTSNVASAFTLLAASYPFHSHKRLITAYDHHSDSLSALLETSAKRGAKLMTTAFVWPSMRIHSSKLRKMLGVDKKNRGLFLFPLQSKVTGARYSYLWLSYAQQNGWHVGLDASALGPKDLDTLGLSLFRPDFVVCSFFKILGQDPSGFACLAIKHEIAAILQISTSAGVVRIIPPGYASGSDTDDSRTFSGPIVPVRVPSFEIEIVEEQRISPASSNRNPQMNCQSLDHADSLGLVLISSRLRYLVNWLVLALTKLQHPRSNDGRPLVRIYGPKVKFDRGPSVAFNLFDWKGEKVDPSLVQKLADRSNISLACGILREIWFSDEHEAERATVMEKKAGEADGKKKASEFGISVVTATLGFLASFEDVYKLWAFVAKFLDADFVEKERWRNLALHQKAFDG